MNDAMKMTMTVETYVNVALKKQNKVIILNDLHIPKGRSEFRKYVMYSGYAQKRGHKNIFERILKIIIVIFKQNKGDLVFGLVQNSSNEYFERKNMRISGNMYTFDSPKHSYTYCANMRNAMQIKN